MPRGSKYEGPPAALDAYRVVIEGSRSGAEVKGAKNPYTSRNGHMFSFLDADGTYPPEHFPALLAAGLEQKSDLVIGSRMAGTDSEMPMSRRIGNLFFAKLVSLLGNHHITDSACGMHIIHRDVLPRL